METTATQNEQVNFEIPQLVGDGREWNIQISILSKDTWGRVYITDLRDPATSSGADEPIRVTLDLEKKIRLEFNSILTKTRHVSLKVPKGVPVALAIFPIGLPFSFQARGSFADEIIVLQRRLIPDVMALNRSWMLMHKLEPTNDSWQRSGVVPSGVTSS